jgi:hypothetical protein
VEVYPDIMKRWLFIPVLSVAMMGAVYALESIPKNFKIGTVDRQALVFPVADAKKRESDVPLVFCFQGHGGGARQASLSFRMHDQWPEAIMVYPQGLHVIPCRG